MAHSGYKDNEGSKLKQIKLIFIKFIFPVRKFCMTTSLSLQNNLTQLTRLLFSSVGCRNSTFSVFFRQ